MWIVRTTPWGLPAFEVVDFMTSCDRRRAKVVDELWPLRSNDLMSRPRITKISIRNFKSIRRADVRLSPLTMLVGRNGVGKSNLLKAIAFLADALDGSLEHAIKVHGGLAMLLPRGSVTGRLAIAVHFEYQAHAGVYCLVIKSAPHGGFEVRHEAGLSRTTMFLVENGVLTAGPPHLVAFHAVYPKAQSGRLLLPFATQFEDFRWLHSALRRMFTYHIDPDSIRRHGSFRDDSELSFDGGNIHHVIYRLMNEVPDIGSRITEYMQAITPHLMLYSPGYVGWKSERGIVFTGSHPAKLIGELFYDHEVSNGTLQALGVLTALFQTHSRTGSPSIVGIEEPEAGLHPGAARVLLDAMLEASRDRQVLASTHSPDLLDSPGLPIEAVRVVDMIDGETVISEPDDAAIDAVKSKLFTAGELLRQNQLGRSLPWASRAQLQPSR
jgi:predicted ATPase